MHRTSRSFSYQVELLLCAIVISAHVHVCTMQLCLTTPNEMRARARNIWLARDYHLMLLPRGCLSPRATALLNTRAHVYI